MPYLVVNNTHTTHTKNNVCILFKLQAEIQMRPVTRTYVSIAKLSNNNDDDSNNKYQYYETEQYATYSIIIIKIITKRTLCLIFAILIEFLYCE